MPNVRERLQYFGRRGDSLPAGLRRARGGHLLQLERQGLHLLLGGAILHYLPVQQRTTDIDFVVGAIKVFSDQAYYYGVPAETVNNFKEGADRTAMWSSLKLSSESLK